MPDAGDGKTAAHPHIQRCLLSALLREFLAYARWHALRVIALTLTVAILEGAGLMLLVPLLELTGVTGSPASAAGSHVSRVFSMLGFTPTLTVVLIIYVGLIGLHSVLSWWRDVVSNWLQQSFVDHLRQQLFDSIGASEWKFLSHTHSAEFSHALTVDIGRVNEALNALFQVATTGAIALAYAGAALYLSWPLTVVTLAAGAVLMLTLRTQHRRSIELGRGLTQTTQNLHENIAEYLAGLKLAKSGNAERYLSLSFARWMREVRESVLGFIRRQAATRGLFRFGGAVVLCGLVYVAVAVIAVSVASVLALTFIFSRLFPFLSQLQQGYQRLLHALPAYDAYRNMRVRCNQAMEPAGTDTPPYEFNGALQLERVSYYPGNTDKPLVQDISFSIPAHSTVAMIGPSGAGKSTLADLLSGLLAPTAGRITVDGRELEDRRTWRQRVAYVPQETFLFNASVRENIRWTLPEVSDEIVWNALEQAAAAAFVHALPQGLDTVIGERGIRLSGGERQRLAIARALLRKPLLLVLDEATSALDRDNERLIQTTLSKLHRRLTIVIIAHREATTLGADQIVSLRHGRVVGIDQREDAETLQATVLGGRTS